MNITNLHESIKLYFGIFLYFCFFWGVYVGFMTDDIIPKKHKNKSCKKLKNKKLKKHNITKLRPSLRRTHKPCCHYAELDHHIAKIFAIFF